MTINKYDNFIVGNDDVYANGAVYSLQVLHGEGSEDWTLQIKFVQKRDNGTYECQVSFVSFSSVNPAAIFSNHCNT